MNVHAFAPPQLHPAIAELAERRQWVAWREEKIGDRFTKPLLSPKSPHANRKASHSDPGQWVSFEEAIAFASENGLSGVGYVLTADDGITGADLDKCRDDTTGAVEPWARQILDFAETYAEVSPSGTGIRLFWRGKIGATVKCDPAHVELYAKQRYLTITGHHVEGTPLTIGEAPQTHRALMDRVAEFRAAAELERRLRREEDGTVTDVETGENFDDLDRARASGLISKPERATRAPGSDHSFFRQVNDLALKSLGTWVPALFGARARFQPGTGAYRVPSRVLGRDLQEDLSIHPDGIADWGVADMGDPRSGKRTAIDLVMEYGLGSEAKLAALWLCDQIGTEPESLGWQEQGFGTVEHGRDILASLTVGGRRAEEGARTETVAPPSGDPDPVDLWSHFDPPALPVGLLPPVLEEFARIQGEVMGADPGGLAAAAIATCAAAIPDRIRLQVKVHDENWMESARIWVALIGDPSTKKSPIMSQAVRPLGRIDARLYRAWCEAMGRYDSLSKDEQKSAERPKQVRLRLEDTTIEAAQEVMKDSPEGVLCYQDELGGWFGSMDKYSGARGAGKDRAFWLQSFNGGSYIVNRVGRGSVWVDNLSVSMLGGIQPELIRKVASETLDDGLLQRLFPIILRPAELGRDEPRKAVVAAYDELIERLNNLLPPTFGGTGNLADVMALALRFDDGAQEVRRNLERDHLKLISVEAVNKKLAAHIGKLDGLFARLCIIWHCIENAEKTRLPPIIGTATAERVAAFLHRFLLPHAIAFYMGVLGLSEGHDALKAIAGYILAHEDLNEVTLRDVQRGDRTMRSLTRDEAQRVLERLEYFGWLDPTSMAKNGTAPRWRVNRRARDLFAEKGRQEANRRQLARETIQRTVANGRG